MQSELVSIAKLIVPKQIRQYVFIGNPKKGKQTRNEVVLKRKTQEDLRQYASTKTPTNYETKTSGRLTMAQAAAVHAAKIAALHGRSMSSQGSNIEFKSQRGANAIPK